LFKLNSKLLFTGGLILESYGMWVKTGKNWLGAYRKKLFIGTICKVIPIVLLFFIVFGVIMSAIDGDKGEELIQAGMTGLGFGVFISIIFLLLLLPGLSTNRMSRNMKKAVKLLNMSETEQEQLGREMLEAVKYSENILNYELLGPNSNKTPARFILSRNYACLWGSSPLVILVRLADVAQIRAETEEKTSTTYGSLSSTMHFLTLYTVTYYYKGSENQDGDTGMGFFDESIRDRVFEMLSNRS